MPQYRAVTAGSSDATDVSSHLIDDIGFGVSGDPLQCSSFEDFRAKLSLIVQSESK